MSAYIPSHPGSFVAGAIEGIEEETGHPVDLAEVADSLGLTASELDAFLNGRLSVTPALAQRLVGRFRSRVEFWLKMQANFDAGVRARDAELVPVASK